MTTTSYRGRFAPTPSGPLHFGSLVAALVSWLDARAAGGEWLVRIDDLDKPREVPGAADRILRQLDAFGLHWDQAVHYQHERLDLYAAAVEQLLRQGDAFYCRLSRADLDALGQRHPGISVAVTGAADAAVRLQVPDTPVCFEDLWQGRYCINLQQAGGAFVIRRRDGLFAYQLACALDDSDDAISRVVRGYDLIDSTPRQLCVLNALARHAPEYAHFPLATDAHGNKLAKSSGARALDEARAEQHLQQALQWLGAPSPRAPVAEQLADAVRWWQQGARGWRRDAGPAPDLSLP